MKKKLVIGILSLFVLVLATFIVKGSFFQKEESNNRSVLKVGNSVISVADIERAEKISGESLSRKEVLKNVVTERLIFQLAEKKNVAATLEEGREEAKRVQEYYKEYPDEFDKVIRPILKKLGVSEDEYWEEIAPRSYQMQLTIGSLMVQLVEENVLSDDAELAYQEFEGFKHQLYLNSLTSDVEALDSKYELPAD